MPGGFVSRREAVLRFFSLEVDQCLGLSCHCPPLSLQLFEPTSTATEQKTGRQQAKPSKSATGNAQW